MQLYLKRERLQHRCFPVNFSKLLRTPFLQNISTWLLLFFANSDKRLKDATVFFLKRNSFKYLSPLQVFSKKKLFLEISQNSQESTGARASYLIKLQARLATLFKKRLWHRCFPVNFAKFLITPFLKNTSWCLLLLKDY